MALVVGPQGSYPPAFRGLARAQPADHVVGGVGVFVVGSLPDVLTTAVPTFC